MKLLVDRIILAFCASSTTLAKRRTVLEFCLRAALALFLDRRSKDRDGDACITKPAGMILNLEETVTK